MYITWNRYLEMVPNWFALKQQETRPQDATKDTITFMKCVICLGLQFKFRLSNQLILWTHAVSLWSVEITIVTFELCLKFIEGIEMYFLIDKNWQILDLSWSRLVLAICTSYFMAMPVPVRFRMYSATSYENDF